MNERIQELAEQCRILEATLMDLYQGRRVVVPHDIDHAHQMLMIASSYIRDDKHRMWSTLTELKNDT